MISNIKPPTADDSQLAVESSRQLVQLLSAGRSSFRVTIESDDKNSEVITIPAAAQRLLSDILTQMAKGNAVTLIPIHAELTTQEAADLLNVSRPYLIGLLEQKKIPFHMTGTHRRIRFKDLMEYKQRDDAERKAVLAALVADTQELGLDD